MSLAGNEYTNAGEKFLSRTTIGNIKYSVIKQYEHCAQQNLKTWNQCGTAITRKALNCMFKE